MSTYSIRYVSIHQLLLKYARMPRLKHRCVRANFSSGGEGAETSLPEKAAAIQ